MKPEWWENPEFEIGSPKPFVVPGEYSRYGAPPPQPKRVYNFTVPHEFWIEQSLNDTEPANAYWPQSGHEQSWDQQLPLDPQLRFDQDMALEPQLGFDEDTPLDPRLFDQDMALDPPMFDEDMALDPPMFDQDMTLAPQIGLNQDMPTNLAPLLSQNLSTHQKQRLRPGQTLYNIANDHRAADKMFAPKQHDLAEVHRSKTDAKNDRAADKMFARQQQGRTEVDGGRAETRELVWRCQYRDNNGQLCPREQNDRTNARKHVLVHFPPGCKCPESGCNTIVSCRPNLKRHMMDVHRSILARHTKVEQVDNDDAEKEQLWNSTQADYNRRKKAAERQRQWTPP